MLGPRYSRLIYPAGVQQRSRLAYPAGRPPGFDPTHHVAAPGCIFSAVANGAGFINLMNGAKGTLAGTVTSAFNSAIGPAPLMNSTSAGWVYAGAKVSPIPFVMAVIFIPNVFTSFTPIIIGSNTNATGIYWAFNSSTTFWILAPGGSGTQTPAVPAFVAGTPYFAAICVYGTATILQTFRYAITNLLTGKVFSGQAALATAVTPAASDGTYSIGADSNFTTNPDANFAAAMMSVGYAPALPQMQAWAEDPWSFWYPTKDKVQFTGGAIAALVRKPLQTYLRR